MANSDFIASPSVRAHAGRLGVDLDELARTSGRKTIAREDIDRHLGAKGPETGTASQMAGNHSRYWDIDHGEFGTIREEKLSRMAKVASDNLSAANSMIPQVTHHDQVDMRSINEFRSQMRSATDRRGIRLTALAFHVMALARCLQDFPLFNTSISADGETLVYKEYIHIGIAVDTPSGLMVPVIRDCDKKGLWAIASEISDLAKRAQERKIRPNEMGGASMSISNLGGIGGTAFTPIVNPPEVAILGITRTRIVPVWEDEEFVPVPMTPLDLSYDHRAINGADAARFLARHAWRLGDIRRLL